LAYPSKAGILEGAHAADCDVIARYSGAKLTDKHLASKIQCVDDGYRVTGVGTQCESEQF
jgi:hypothetical protein